MIPLLLLWSCTFSPGEGFGEIVAASLDVALVPGAARDLGDDTILTDAGYHVAFSRLELSLAEVELQELQGGGGVVFDPASPPEGYTLCHGDHCHSEEGSLVSYADIIAELAGDDATWVAIAAAPVARTVDLLAGDSSQLTFDQAWLPRADISRFVLGASWLGAEATVTGGGLAEGEALPLAVDMSFEDAFSFALDLPIDRDHDPSISLAISIEPDGTLLDGLDLAAVGAGGAILLEDPHSEGPGQQLFDALIGTWPEISITRTP